MKQETIDRRHRVLAASNSFRQASEALGDDTSRDALQSWAKSHLDPQEYTRLCIRSDATRVEMTARMDERVARGEHPRKAPLTEEGLESLARDEMVSPAEEIRKWNSSQVTTALLGQAVLDTLSKQAKELILQRGELSEERDRLATVRQDLSAALTRVSSLQEQLAQAKLSAHPDAGEDGTGGPASDARELPLADRQQAKHIKETLGLGDPPPWPSGLGND